MAIKKRWPAENPTIKSYRELLGVDANSSGDDLKKAYRRMAQLYHPDKNPDEAARAQFVKITQAYETLVDPIMVEALNQKFMKDKLYNQCIEGINITFGSFFGYRIFSLGKRVPRSLRIGDEKAGEADRDLGTFEFEGSQEDISILDSPAYDSIELVFGGKFSIADEERVREGFEGPRVGQLPWVLLNNRGILEFLDRRYEDSRKSYEELNRRIPNNIIFLYRLGLCHVILAFQNLTRSFFGKAKPQPKHLKAGLDALRRAVAIGESREVGRQKCLMIRKTIAEVLEKMGKVAASKKMWKEIRDMQPRSKEAIYKLQGTAALLKAAFPKKK